MSDQSSHTTAEEISVRTRSQDSTNSKDDSSFPRISLFIEIPQANKTFEQLVDAYYYYAQQAIASISGAVVTANAAMEYHLVPIVVAENVSPDVLESLPSNFKGYKIRCQVRHGRLLIVELSSGQWHGAGVANLCSQMGRWQGEHRHDLYFALTTDSVYRYEDNSAAPDVVVLGYGPYRIRQAQHKLVIVELEVSNRTVPGMRRDYGWYFNEDSMHSVIGIKLFGATDTCPGRRAAAVHWVMSEAGGIVVARAVDFGLLPLTDSAKRYFAEAAEAGHLPAVNHLQWERCAPIPADMLAPAASPTEQQLAALCRWFVHPQSVVYPEGLAVITIEADRLCTTLLPIDGVPVTAEDISDLRVDLGRMLQLICSVAADAIDALIGPAAPLHENP